MIQTITRFLLCTSLGALMPSIVFAQQPYPVKSILITVGLQAGTGSDVAVRNVAEKMSASMGQPVVVVNLPGAAGLMAAQNGAKANPDGYSLVALSSAAVTTLPHMQKDSFNPTRDLRPIAVIVSFPSVISVHRSVPANNIREFIELVKKNPGKYTYASGGNGSVQHTAMEELMAMTGMNLLHVPYKGMAQATTDLVGGQVDSAIQGVVAVVPFAKNQVRVLAWTGAKRNPLYPELPTLNEAGVTGYQFQSWTGLYAPATAPKEVVNRLSQEVRKAIAFADLREKWASQGMETVDTAPQELERQIREESDRMGKLVRSRGLRMD